MSKVHLTYFDLRALGEPIRMLLAYGKIPYKETRIERFGKEWPVVKNEYPMGQLPVLEIDDLKLSQSKAICRYIARKINLDGDDEKDRVAIDIASDVIYDFIMKLRIMREFDNPEAQNKKYEEFKATVFPFYLRNLDDMVKNNGGYFANSKLTWVDFYFAGANEYFSLLARFNILEEYIHLKQLVDKVLSLQQLKEYLKFRPESEF